MSPPVAILTVTHNDAEELEEWIQALDRLATGEDVAGYRLVAVDSGSEDDTAERLSRLAGRWPLRSELLDDNVGFAAGMNRAIELAPLECELLLLLNADARPRPDSVRRLVAAWRTHHRPGRLELGAVAARLVRPRSPSEPGLLDACGMRLTPTWRHLDRGSGKADRGQYGERELVFGATGAASLFFRRALEDVAIDGDILDPRFHSFREDAELCFRLQERGWSVLYEPSAEIVHRRSNLPERRSSMPAAVNYHSLKNRYLLRLYHQTAGNLVSTSLPTLAREAAIVAWVLLRERSSLAAYRWVWHHRRALWQRRRRIQGRRKASARQVNRWFWRHQLPLPPATDA